MRVDLEEVNESSYDLKTITQSDYSYMAKKLLYNILAIQNSKMHVYRKPISIKSGIKTALKSGKYSTLKFSEINVCDQKFTDLRNRQFDRSVNSGRYGYSFPITLHGLNKAVRAKVVLSFPYDKSPINYIDIYTIFREAYYGLRYINPFVNIIPNFVETYGIYTCQNIGNNECLGKPLKSNIFLITEQVDNLGSFSNFLIGSKPPKLILGLILQAVCAAELLGDYGIHHGDLDLNNILIQKTDIEGYTVPLKSGDQIVKTYGYMCRIIDYGLTFTDDSGMPLLPDSYSAKGIMTLLDKLSLRLENRREFSELFSDINISTTQFRKRLAKEIEKY